MSKITLAEQISEAKLRDLIKYRFEADELDFKLEFDSRSKRDCVELCKDIIAMANAYGGHIILGVSDADYSPVGLSIETPLDPADISNTLDNYVQEKIEWLAADYILDIEGVKRKFGIIYVAPSRTPIVTTKTGAYQHENRQKVVFRESEFYVRDGSRSKPASAKELRNIIASRQSSSASFSPNAIITSTEYEPPVIHNLPRPNFLNFIGRREETDQIIQALDHPRAWTIAIEGVGGVGKTALAQKVAADIVNQVDSPWKFVIWISAKETVLTPDKIESVQPDLRNLEDLLDAIILVSNLAPEPASLTYAEKLAEVKMILSEFQCLLLVDNLETLEDEAVMRFVTHDLPSPSKAIITSRKRTSRLGGLTIPLKGLQSAQAITLLKEAAEYQGSAIIRSAPQSQLEEIVELTGGIPLALRLVVGQTALGTHLSTVLERLTHSDGQSILDFCFRETYRDLSPQSQQLLGALAILDESATLDEVAMLANLPFGEASKSVEQLSRLSLVEENYDDAQSQQVYFLLPLTQAFAIQQVRKFTEFHHAVENNIALYRLQKIQFNPNEVNKESIRNANAKSALECMAVSLTDKAEEHYQRKEHAEAMKLIREAERLAPRLAYVQQAWAYMARRSNQLTEAREHYQRSVELAPSRAEYYRYWASLEAKVGQYVEAVRLYRQANLLDPSDPFVKQGLANAMLRKAQKMRYGQQKSGWEETRLQALSALGVIEDLFERHGEWARSNAPSWQTKAEILKLLKRPKQALEICNQALSVGYDSRIASLAAELENDLR